MKTKASTVPPAAEAHPWRRAAVWLAFLGPFFFLSYGFANWWTGQLARVDSVVFGWEKHIPFWDWTILPYMSLDAFYAGSLFLCATRAELDTHARRLFSASLISVVGFLLFPLQFSFVRPATSGFNGALFDVLMGFDKPYNQAPSLHISLVLLVWLVFARHLRGLALWAGHAWFLLIALSVFTTYQHHFIDGVTGGAVGVVCVYLFPDFPVRWLGRLVLSDDPLRRKLTVAYGLGALLCFGLALVVGGWAWLLAWPGGALLLVSLAYAGLGTSVFQKHDGKLSWAARTLLAPYQIGAWWSSRWFTRHGVPSVEVAPGIWLGRAPGRADWQARTFGAVLDVTAEFSLRSFARALPHRSVPLLDLVVPTVEQLAATVAALTELEPHRPVLVHCALGYSRSALTVAAWLLHHRGAPTPDAAIAQLRAARPQVVFSAAHRAALVAYQATLAMKTVLSPN
ncbi:dual specificity protein phosphatase family protein [Hymenobacter sp. BT664]|uniref:Dual specificity protein phosphatase family protein n=1 Tax=Hymenobacter montanus TaxID=2771359 RepID=A0A927BEZ3_9BACT|nr:dual specificity protein phosphatase family protein [Hymenobacter montanus]MBD2769641.1 dual specificity protein phosphatase family protein [Hymenobacter montanus]